MTPPPTTIEKEPLCSFLLSLADDELILGHRNSEWTGHAPILEEDIAFSNLAQDEMGHALAFYTLYQQLTGTSPDTMGFGRSWKEFRCCRLVTYPKGDFAYTVVRQFLYDSAEQVRLESLRSSSYTPLKDIAERMLLEEQYHVLHSQGLFERLGSATKESCRRMQAAVDMAFPQALGIFERLPSEENLRAEMVFVGNAKLKEEWLRRVVPVIMKVSLRVPIKTNNGNYAIQCMPEEGGRTGNHSQYLQQVVEDMQRVYCMIPNARW